MKFIYLIVILINVQVIFSSQHSVSVNDDETGRLFWNALGTFIDDSEWFPIEFNVPDIIQGIGQGIGSMYNYVSTTWASMAGSSTVSSTVVKDEIPSNIPKTKSVKKKKKRKKNKEYSIWNF